MVMGIIHICVYIPFPTLLSGEVCPASLFTTVNAVGKQKEQLQKLQHLKLVNSIQKF